MSDQLRGPGLEACPQCGEEKTSYPQHWNRSTSCDYPTLDPQIHHVATGALMGDGSLEGRERTKLRIETTTREFALWLHEQFGMAAGSVRRFPQDGPDQDVYRVSTIAHPEFNHYRDWYRDGEKCIPERVRLQPLSARVFVACDGSLSFGGNEHPRMTFSAVDGSYREDLARTLSRLEIGITPRVGSRRVSINVPDVPRLLEWIGDIPFQAPNTSGRPRRPSTIVFAIGSNTSKRSY